METELNNIKKFLDYNNFVLYGVSDKKEKFGNEILRHLVKRGKKIFPVHPALSGVQGINCYSDINSIKEDIDAAIIVLSPENTEKVLPDILIAGIKNIWIQQRSESDNAIKFCEENGISLIHGQCLLMFSEPVTFIHRFHRWINKAIGKYPK
jgi:uncharacterized protein